jgi:hypothetical protein
LLWYQFNGTKFLFAERLLLISPKSCTKYFNFTLMKSRLWQEHSRGGFESAGGGLSLTTTATANQIIEYSIQLDVYMVIFKLLGSIFTIITVFHAWSSGDSSHFSIALAASTYTR